MSDLPAGRELDALVAERVMGKPFRHPKHGNCCTCQVCGWHHDECQCDYSEDIGMAWAVVEKMNEAERWPTIHYGPSENGELLWWVELVNPATKAITADSAAHAICLAALAACLDPTHDPEAPSNEGTE